MSKIIHTLCKLSQSIGKSKVIPFQIVQAVLKHPNYPHSLGTAILINSTGEKQQLSAVCLWTVMAKTKELTEDLRLRIQLQNNIPLPP